MACERERERERGREREFRGIAVFADGRIDRPPVYPCRWLSFSFTTLTLIPVDVTGVTAKLAVAFEESIIETTDT